MSDLTRSEQMAVANAVRLGREMTDREPWQLLLAVLPSLSDADRDRLLPYYHVRVARFAAPAPDSRRGKGRLRYTGDGPSPAKTKKTRIIRKAGPMS